MMSSVLEAAYVQVKALETLRNVYVLAEYVGGGELEPQPRARKPS